jgi:protein TonB
MHRANVGLRYANELTDQLAESIPSAASQASQGAESQSPELVFNPAPQYPADALAARLTGRVLVRVVLAADGSVAEASVHRSSGSVLLDEAAVDAVRMWRFAPSERGTAPRRLAVPINFVIQEGS